jgi:hypothetical protein
MNKVEGNSSCLTWTPVVVPQLRLDLRGCAAHGEHGPSRDEYCPMTIAHRSAWLLDTLMIDLTRQDRYC